jgi:hypothetical protein
VEIPKDPKDTKYLVLTSTRQGLAVGICVCVCVPQPRRNEMREARSTSRGGTLCRVLDLREKSAES